MSLGVKTSSLFLYSFNHNREGDANVINYLSRNFHIQVFRKIYSYEKFKRFSEIVLFIAV